MKKGQRFTSQSKIQNHPTEYIFNGRILDDNLGSHHNTLHLISITGNPADDIFVDDGWFNERKITKLKEEGNAYRKILQRKQ